MKNLALLITVILFYLPVSLYPHNTNMIDNAEKAVRMIDELRPLNVDLAFVLCHEMKYGNAGRIEEVIQNVKDPMSGLFLTRLPPQSKFGSANSMGPRLAKAKDILKLPPPLQCGCLPILYTLKHFIDRLHSDLSCHVAY